MSRNRAFEACGIIRVAEVIVQIRIWRLLSRVQSEGRSIPPSSQKLSGKPFLRVGVPGVGLCLVGVFTQESVKFCDVLMQPSQAGERAFARKRVYLSLRIRAVFIRR